MAVLKNDNPNASGIGRQVTRSCELKAIDPLPPGGSPIQSQENLFPRPVDAFDQDAFDVGGF